MSSSSRAFIIIATMAVSATGFIAGRWSVNRPAESPVSSGVGRAVAKTGNLDRLSGQIRPAGKALPAAEADTTPSKERLTRIRKETNRLARLKRVLEWAESIDENNWRDALAVWQRSGSSSGFERDTESRIVFERIGAVGGAAALAEISDSSGNPVAVEWRSRQTMSGWASTHPREAMDWYRQSGSLPGEMRGGLMEGLTQADLDLARELSEDVREEWRDEHFRGIMENMERNGEGTDAVRAWIARTVEANKDPDYTGQLITTYAERELELLQAGGGNTGIYDWLAHQHAFPGSSYEVLGTAAVALGHVHPEEALGWIAGLTPGAMSPEGIAGSVAEIVRDWQTVRPGAADEWLNIHPNDPLHDAVQQALVAPPRVSIPFTDRVIVR